MEIRIKNKNKIKESKGPELEQKWGILKYLSAEISFEKSNIIQGQMTRVTNVLGQTLEYDSRDRGSNPNTSLHYLTKKNVQQSTMLLIFFYLF